MNDERAVNEIRGTVLSIALRTAPNGPMQEVPEATAARDAGLQGDLPVEPDRGVTLISSERWRDALAELGRELPWHTRRANVLVQGLELGPLIGHRVTVGEVELAITGETKPCGLMDRLSPGLRQALKPDFRGGVLGRVLVGGRIRTGDTVRPLD